MLALLESQPQVLAELQDKIRYLIVDEYQDTNTIQERILLKLSGMLKKFGETVKNIESHRFSNKGIVKCERLCDGCDMRFYCNYK
jgi:superfamily I DNA/RNA helicase